MGPKRTQYERCRKALNAFDLVYQMCEGGVNSTHTSIQEKLENEFSAVQSDVTDARRRFEKARARHADLVRLVNDLFWSTTEREVLRHLEKTALAELNAAEAEWNDI